MTKYVGGVSSDSKRYLLICCEIMFREACNVLSSCDAVVDPVFMGKELHDIGEKDMSKKIQAIIDQTDIKRYDAILLGYGLCNYGVCGLHAEIPLVIPRAHDCITLLLGSKQRYLEYFNKNPGVFFKSPGWLERDIDPADNPDSITTKMGIIHDLEKLREVYDEDEAEYLIEVMGNWLGNYTKITYIDTYTGNTEKYLRVAKEQADILGLPFETLKGDISIFEKMVSGCWKSDTFLVVSPGEYICSSDSDEIICTKSFTNKRLF